MDVAEQKKQAKTFAKRWENRGDEKQDSQSFWLDLLEHVLGVEEPEEFINFEKRVKLDNTSFIDGYIEQTKTLIEQKSSTKDLDKGIKQSDGSLLTPFQQAKRYAANLPYSERPRWIVTSNFKEFRIYDMEHPNSEPRQIRLEDLGKEYYSLELLVDTSNQHLAKEQQVSIKAGELVGLLYNELLKQYKNPDAPETLKSINMLCVRIVFCLYAEDAGLFGRHDMFHDYLAEKPTNEIRRALIDLFKVLDTKVEDRDPYLSDDDPKLAEFPYVNGGMFADENIEIPPFTDELKNLLLNKASLDFDWSDISPTIFGGVFESTLNPETRRQGGMHYTSVENIHKVIDPLFLNDLKDELNRIKQYKQPAILKQKAKEFQLKLAQIHVFDPACGSGNFLTETYLQLRKLENEAIKLIYGDQPELDTNQNIIQVSIQQFYGIEINDFAVSVAKTALWIAESQMFEETKDIIYSNNDFLPLKTYTHIVEGNALRLDWNTVVPNYQTTYIISNPPFIGARLQTQEQKKDLKDIFGKQKGINNLDYVSGWYKLASEYMKGTRIKAAFVSTNSITQGEQPAILWKPIFEDKDFNFNFAYRTFRWDSEAKTKAQVHVIIIGFSYVKSKTKVLYSESNIPNVVSNINSYLLEGSNVFVSERTSPISNVDLMNFGSMPNDGGYLSKIDQDEMNTIISKYPQTESVFHKLIGSSEFLNNRTRYCLWLYHVDPSLWRKVPPILERVEKVRKLREDSKRPSTKNLAATPYLFGEIRQPDSNYLVIPAHSSQNRRYIPMGFESPDVIASNALLIIPNSSLYEFGIMESNVHMGWVRTVAGRIKSDYRYSAKVVYNNFPWPKVNEEQRKKIEKTAQGIIDARNLYPNASLADLYDELSMPPELRKAHQANDRAVMAAYGLPVKGTTESDAVAHLFKMYEKLIEKK